MNENERFDLTNEDFLERVSFYKENLGLDIVPFFKKSDDIRTIQSELVRSVLMAIADTWEIDNPLAETLSENVNPGDYRNIQEEIRASAVAISNSDIQKVCSICFTGEKIFEYYNARGKKIKEMMSDLKNSHDKLIKGKKSANEVALFMNSTSALAFGAAHLNATEAVLIEVATPFTEIVARAAELLVSSLNPALIAAIIVAVVILGVVLAMMLVTKTVMCLIFNDTDHDMYSLQWSQGAAGKDGDVYIPHGQLTSFMEDDAGGKHFKRVQIPKRPKLGNPFGSFFVTEKCTGFYGSESTIRFRFDGLNDTVTLLTACPYSQNNRINVRLNESRPCKSVHSELYDSAVLDGKVIGSNLECSYHMNSSSGSTAFAIVYIKEHHKEFINFETEKEVTSSSVSLVSKNTFYDPRYQCQHMRKDRSIKIRANMDTNRSIRVYINMCYVLAGQSLDAPATISVNGHPVLEGLNAQDWSFKDYSFVIPNFFLQDDSNNNIELEIKQTGGIAGLFIKQIVLQYEDEEGQWQEFPNKFMWMQDIPNTTQLSDINIPGTHDSAAINIAIHTPYACHKTTIKQQLYNGIRLFDVRLKVKKNKDGSYYFVTCHGPVLSSLGINEYQTFVSLMDEFKNFLKKFPSEVLVVSLKIDDWNKMEKDRDVILKQLKGVLSDYPLSGHYKENVKIGDVRGKIYLLNRITNDLDFGTPISWAEATEWQEADGGEKREYKIYVQDKYKGLSFNNPEGEKFNLVVNAFSKKTDGCAILNYASACRLGVIGVYFPNQLMKYWLQTDADKRQKKMGWLLMDYETELVETVVYGKISLVDIYIDSNFGYRRYCYKSEINEGNPLPLD